MSVPVIAACYFEMKTQDKVKTSKNLQSSSQKVTNDFYSLALKKGHIIKWSGFITKFTFQTRAITILLCLIIFFFLERQKVRGKEIVRERERLL